MKPTIGKIASVIKDPMVSDQFIMEFPDAPTSASDSEPLMIHCQQATKPGMTLNQVEVQLFGHTLEYAGNLTFSHDMQTQFVENVRGGIVQTVEAWMLLARNHRTQHGGFKNEYSRDGKLTIFDNKGAAVLIYRIVGIWPNTMPDTQMDGTAANLILHGVGWKYDYYEVIGGYGARNVGANSAQ